MEEMGAENKGRGFRDTSEAWINSFSRWRDGGRTVKVRSQSLWQMGAVIYALQGNLRRPRTVLLKQVGLPWISLCIRKRDTGDAYFQTLQ